MVEEKEGKITSVDSIEQPEQELETAEEKKDESVPQAEATEKKDEVPTDSPSKLEEEKSEKDSPQKEPKKIEKEVDPLSGKLFSYFEGEVNYTLAGYVSKIFGSFLTKKPVVVLTFLLSPSRFASLLNHIESRSVCELVIKLLTHESTELLEERKKCL